MMEENIPSDSRLPEEPVEVVDIQFRPGQKIYYFDPAGQKFQVGDHVIIETARGMEFGTCTGENHKIPKKDVVAPLRSVLRKANHRDEKTAQENHAREKRAYDICLQKIAEHKLDMQLVSAEYAFDGSKILFFFTADERVDFRELVKNLAGIFHTRIELRQIGVRDKAKMVGGLGICGRPFCCSTFLDDFQPVSIKMAKTQNLSLNPSKISGTCGRLLCCLKYEQEAYEDLLKTSPKQDSFVDTPKGRGTVTEVNLLRQQVKVRMEKEPDTIAQFANDEIAVFRNGKARKNDPPIPADWAPISGDGCHLTKEEVREKAEDAIVLEPIRFKYSSESLVDDPAPQKDPAGEENTVQAKRPPRRRPRGNRSGHPQESRPQQKKQGGNSGSPEKSASQNKGQGSKPRNQKPRPPKAAGTPGAEGQAPAKKTEGGTNAPRRRRRPSGHNRKPRQTPEQSG